LIAGLDYHRKLGNFDLSSTDKHRYLNTDYQTLDQFACTKQMQEKFMIVQKCFDVIGFSQEEVQSLYCILAAVIHLGDIEIISDDSLTHHGERGCIKRTDTINTVASLLCVDTDDLSNALTSTSSVTRGETILRYNTVEQSCDCRDATAKALYSKLFSWIVKRVNILLKSNDMTSPRNNFKRIGILDIFGFENLSTNSFEQLCINIANEQLQFYFNQHVFEWEFEEYASEGIPLDTITFQNNRPVLEMFLQRPMGILALLDEESRFPRATVFSLVEKFYDNMSKDYFQKPKDSTTMFVIHHYAGKVIYDANGFLEKNRDTISSDVSLLLQTSEDRLIRTIFQGTTDHIDDLRRRGSISSTDSFTLKGDGTENKPTLANLSTSKLHLTMSTHFRNSLRSLMAKMIQADPHFIRCIRPNSKNVPDLFDQTKVMTQLRYTGVLETSKIRRQGYSERIQFSEFVIRYQCLVYYLRDDPPRDADTCRRILKKLGMEMHWRIGKTKVFLKYFQVAKLNFLLEEHRRHAIKLQRLAKAWLFKVRFIKEKAVLAKAASVIQRNIRGWLARKRCAYKRRELEDRGQMEVDTNTMRIQSGHVERKKDNDEAVRGFLAQKRFKKLTEEYKQDEQEVDAKIVDIQTEDESSSEKDEGEMALQDTKLFFFLAQVQMSTADYVPLLHRTRYPVLFSLRQAATELARKEASNLKIGSRERVLAVLDGTDDLLHRKYHWAREQFEPKVSRGRSSDGRDGSVKKRGLVAGNANEFAVRPRSNNLKFQESTYLLRKSDNFSNRSNQQNFKKLIENEEREQIKNESDVRKTERGKEYPLRSLTERKINSDSDTTDSRQFRWFVADNDDQLSFLARETSLPSEETVHHHLDVWKKSLKQFYSPSSVPQQPNKFDQRPFVKSNRRNSEEVNGISHPYTSMNLHQTNWKSGRGVTLAQSETHTNKLENDQNVKQSKGREQTLFPKEKVLRDSSNRVLPRTVAGIPSEKEEHSLLGHRATTDSRNGIAHQIANNLSVRKVMKSQKGTAVLPTKAKIFPKNGETNDRSLTSMENLKNIKQINGFSYGIQEEQRGALQGLHLRKTGRLQMLVHN